MKQRGRSAWQPDEANLINMSTREMERVANGKAKGIPGRKFIRLRRKENLHELSESFGSATNVEEVLRQEGMAEPQEATPPINSL